MIGIISVAAALALMSPDVEPEDGTDVADVLDHKRKSEHYPQLLEQIRRDGMELPIVIRTHHGIPWLVDGHHRVAAAIDLGITHLVWSDLPLEVEDRPYDHVMRGDWGPFRPAA